MNDLRMFMQGMIRGLSPSASATPTSKTVPECAVPRYMVTSWPGTVKIASA